MKKIRIAYDEENDEYSYECPFCKKKRVYPDDYLCKHVIFAHDGVNGETLDLNAKIESKLYDVLMEKRVSFLSGFYEKWEDFRPCARRSTNPEEWDSAKGEAIGEYLWNGMDVADFRKILRCSDLKNRLTELIFAKTEDDVEGFGCTTVILSADPSHT